MARQGKFARLPHTLKKEVNQRLLNNEGAAKILAWLNALPEAARVWDEYFGGDPATPQNLSEWRKGGYLDWLEEQQEAELLKSMSEHAANLAKSGGNISDGSAAILGGHILQSMQALIHADEGDETPDDPVGRIVKLADAVKKLRDGDRAKEKLDLDKDRHSTVKEKLRLDRDKMERQTVEKFMAFAQTKEAQTILNSSSSKSVKMADLRKLMFG